LALPLLACDGKTSTLCQKKLLDSNAFQKREVSLKVSKDRRLIYSDRKISNYIKYDKFLHLYLVKSQDSFKYPFLFTKDKPSSLIANSQKDILHSKIIQKQIGLNNFARLKNSLRSPLVVTDNCCAVEGVVTSKGMIEKEYLQHFLNSKSSDYADFGFRVKEFSKKVVITKVNLFIKNNPFREGDEIISMDSKKIYSASTLMKRVLFSKIGSKHTLRVKRDSKVIKLVVKAHKRLAGGFVKETFLEYIGLFLDSSNRLTKDNVKYQLKKRDKVLYINSKKISSSDDIYRAFRVGEDNKFLILRDGFSFTIKI